MSWDLKRMRNNHEPNISCFKTGMQESRGFQDNFHIECLLGYIPHAELKGHNMMFWMLCNFAELPKSIAENISSSGIAGVYDRSDNV